MSLPEFPNILSNRYEILEVLGEGGMGNVYLAQDKQLPRLVAIKEVRKEFLDNEELSQRIEREAQLHAKIGSHENIVTLYDVVKSDAGMFIVLEYCDGKTLAEIVEENLENGVRLSESVVLNVVLQLLKALKRIHSHDVIHRDLKPSNLLISRDESEHWQVKLMDFGIAKASAATDADITQLTQTSGSGPGTPSYMAPEQIDAATYGDISNRTDIYAVGVIFYELMTGVPPFGGTLTEIYRGHLLKEAGDLPSADKMTAQWREIICKALEKSPSDRFHSVGELSSAIESNARNASSNEQAGGGKMPASEKTRLAASDSNRTQVTGSDALADLLELSRKASSDNKTIASQDISQGVASYSNPPTVDPAGNRLAKTKPIMLIVLALLVFMGATTYILNQKAEQPAKENVQIKPSAPPKIEPKYAINPVESPKAEEWSNESLGAATALQDARDQVSKNNPGTGAGTGTGTGTGGATPQRKKYVAPITPPQKPSPIAKKTPKKVSPISRPPNRNNGNKNKKSKFGVGNSQSKSIN